MLWTSVKAFWLPENKTISALAADWAKSKKYEEPAGSKDNVANMDKGVSSNQGSLCPVMDLQVGPGFGSSFLVLPITIEPSKPRMCHDERYLNLWIRTIPSL